MPLPDLPATLPPTQSPPPNPFTSLIDSLEDSESNASERARTIRQESCLAQLIDRGGFSGDRILANRVAARKGRGLRESGKEDVGWRGEKECVKKEQVGEQEEEEEEEEEEEDPRWSVVHVVRLRGQVKREVLELQRRIASILHRHTTPSPLTPPSPTHLASSSSSSSSSSSTESTVIEKENLEDFGIWMTPEDDLHLTLLDILSCVSKEEIESLVLQYPTHLRGTRPEHSTPTPPTTRHPYVSLTEARVMIDQNALAVTFNADGLLQARESMFRDTCDAGITPRPRYVGLSAHVTVIRFTKDLNIIGGADGVRRLVEKVVRLDVSREFEGWRIGREEVKCIWGQVFYGHGKTL